MANKYNAKPVVIDGIKFHSTGEGNRYKELKYQKYAGLIRDFEMQVPIICTVANKKICAYICDFVVTLNDGSIVHEDYKGFKTAIYILKKKLVEALHGIKIVEVLQQDVKKIAGTIDNSKAARKQEASGLFKYAIKQEKKKKVLSV